MENTITPKIGKLYSPYESGVKPLKLVSEDGEYYHFDDKTKFGKVHRFDWFEREEEITKPVESEAYVLKYSDYSDWSRMLAKEYSEQELTKELSKLENNTEKLAMQHLSAIKRTTSMTSNSQSRAQARNVVTGNYEKKQAYRGALEIIKIFDPFTGKTLTTSHGV